MTSRARWLVAGAVILGLVTSACAQEVSRSTFKNAEGKDVGTLTIEHLASGTVFMLDLHDLPPGPRAMHLHAVGTCTPPSFDSAGPHWNPTGKQHGKENPQGPHLGDLPNITIKPDGTLETQFTIQGITLRGEQGLLDGDGGAMIIHAGPDDYKTDPTGNAGARIACAVVGIPARQE